MDEERREQREIISWTNELMMTKYKGKDAHGVIIWP